jgi:hypothetical protein
VRRFTLANWCQEEEIGVDDIAKNTPIQLAIALPPMEENIVVRAAKNRKEPLPLTCE